MRHILPDGHPRGNPVVPNGLSLSKIRQAAYDANYLGVRPDFVVEVRRDVSDAEDGPMLLHGLQEMTGVRLTLPRAAAARPDPSRLESGTSCSDAPPETRQRRIVTAPGRAVSVHDRRRSGHDDGRRTGYGRARESVRHEVESLDPGLPGRQPLQQDTAAVLSEAVAKAQAAAASRPPTLVGHPMLTPRPLGRGRALHQFSQTGSPRETGPGDDLFLEPEAQPKCGTAGVPPEATLRSRHLWSVGAPY